MENEADATTASADPGGDKEDPDHSQEHFARLEWAKRKANNVLQMYSKSGYDEASNYAKKRRTSSLCAKLSASWAKLCRGPSRWVVEGAAAGPTIQHHHRYLQSTRIVRPSWRKNNPKLVLRRSTLLGMPLGG